MRYGVRRALARAVLLVAVVVLGQGGASHAEDEHGSLPPSPAGVDPAIGLTGFWDIAIRLPGGGTHASSIRIEHDRGNDALDVALARSQRAHEGERGHPSTALFLRTLHEFGSRFRKSGDRLVLDEYISPYAGRFAASWSVRDWNRLEGTFTVRPDSIQLRKNHGRHTDLKRRTFTVRLSRRVPTIDSVVPTWITRDDLQAKGGQISVTLYGENLPIARLVHFAYPFNNVRSDASDVKIRAARSEDNSGRRLDLELEIKPRAPAGPRGLSVLGWRFPEALRVVELAKDITFWRNPSSPQFKARQVGHLGYAMPTEVRVAVAKLPGAASSSPVAKVWVDKRPVAGQAPDSAQALPMRRAGPRQAYWVGERPLLVAWPEDAKPRSPLNFMHLQAGAGDFVHVQVGSYTSTLPFSDACWPLWERLRTMRAELEAQEERLAAVRAVRQRIVTERAPWAARAATVLTPFDALGDIATYLDGVRGFKLTPAMTQATLPALQKYVAEGRAGSVTRTVLAQNLAGQRTKLATALQALRVPELPAAIAEADLGRWRRALGAPRLAQGLADAPGALFPAPFAPIPDGDLDATVVTLGVLLDSPGGQETYKWPSASMRALFPELVRTETGTTKVPLRFDNAARSITLGAAMSYRLAEPLLAFCDKNDADGASADLTRECATVTLAFHHVRRWRALRALRLGMDARGFPEYVAHARAVLDLLDRTQAPFDARLEQLELDVQQRRDRYAAGLARFVDCIAHDGKEGMAATRLAEYERAVTARLDAMEAFLAAESVEFAHGVQAMHTASVALRTKSRALADMLLAAQDTLHLRWERPLEDAVVGTDLAMLAVAFTDLARTGFGWARNAMKAWSDEPARGSQILRQLQDGLRGDAKPDARGLESLRDAAARNRMSPREVGDLTRRINRGEPLERALRGALARRNAVPPGVLRKRLEDQGMSGPDAAKLVQRLPEGGMSPQELERFLPMVRAMTGSDPRAKAAATRDALGHLRGALGDLQRRHRVELPILSVGSGTDVDKLWSGAHRGVGDMKDWSLLGNDWDGAFFFHPDPAKGRAQVQKVFGSLTPDEVRRYEREFRAPRSLATMRRNRARLARGSKDERRQADRLRERIERLEHAMATRKLEGDFKKLFKERAGYPPEAPDFYLFGDKPVSRMLTSKQVRDGLASRRELLRHVDVGPDGIFFTSGGKKYIELMRTADTPVWLPSGGGAARPLTTAQRQRLITRGAMSPADGADMTSEMAGFWLQNLQQKYGLRRADLDRALRTPRGTALPGDLDLRLRKAAHKTGKYYLRAALGRIAAHKDVGSRLPALFASKTGSPEARVLAIAKDLARSDGVFDPQEIRRLEQALRLKKNGAAGLEDPARVLEAWRGDLERWSRATGDRSRDWFKEALQKAAREPDPVKRAEAIRRLRELQQTHRNARDIALSRATPEQLRSMLGMNAEDARRARILRGNPNLAPLHDPSGLWRTTPGALLRNVAPNGASQDGQRREGWSTPFLDTIDMPPDWLDTLNHIWRRGGALAWVQALVNAGYNTFTGPVETLARVVLMSYKFVAIDRRAHDRIAASTASYIMSLREITKDLARASRLTPHPERLERWRKERRIVNDMVEAIGQSLQAERAFATDAMEIEHLDATIAKWRSWATGRTARRIASLDLELGSLLASVPKAYTLARGLAPAGSPTAPPPADSKDGAVCAKWGATLTLMKQQVLDEARFREKHYIESSRVLLPVAAMHAAARALAAELAALGARKE